MKRTRNLLISSIALLLVAVVGLAGGTFAWFTFANVVSISEFQTNVVTGDSLQASVAATGKVYQNYFLHSYLETEGALIRPMGTAVMDAVTPAYAGANGIDLAITGNTTLSFSRATATSGAGEDPTFTLAAENTAGEDFISLKLFFKASANLTAQASGLDELFANVIEPVGQEISILKSLRVAYIWRELDDEGGVASGGATGWKVFAPDTAPTAGLTLQPEQVQTEEDNLYGWTEQMYYDGYKKTDPTGDALDLFTFDNYAEQIFELNVYIWIEGFDIDCNSSAQGMDFTTAFKFTKKA